MFSTVNLVLQLNIIATIGALLKIFNIFIKYV